jgi:hypothetical protein
MTNANKVDTLKRDFPKLLESSLGIISNACKKAGISRTTYYKWLADPEFSKSCYEVQEYTIDMVETALFDKIFKDKDTASTLFYLKTKAKHRGYVERVESTGRDGNPIYISLTPLQERNLDIIRRVTEDE